MCIYFPHILIHFLRKLQKDMFQQNEGGRLWEDRQRVQNRILSTRVVPQPRQGSVQAGAGGGGVPGGSSLGGEGMESME